jgi:hypothetical protein
MLGGPPFRIRVINCEIRVVIYTIFEIFESECFRKESSERGMRITPTKSEDQSKSRGNDFP